MLESAFLEDENLISALLDCQEKLQEDPNLDISQFLSDYGLTDDQRKKFLENYDVLNVLNDFHGYLKQKSLPDARTSAKISSIGRFVVIRDLGRGGSSRVVLANDPLLKREVALKIPHPNWMSEETIQRFVQEAQLTARLRHPHIVPLHEVGEADGQFFLVYEYCAGGSLAQWLRKQESPVSPALAAWIVSCIAAAVQSAHESGILHRDLKPGNVLLQPNANNQTAPEHFPFNLVVSDFGLAKVMDAKPVASSTENLATPMTNTGLLLGTPQYMAPEQTESKSSDIGPSTDVFAIGVILYQLLIGRTPFQSNSDWETIHQIRTFEVVDAHRLRPDVPKDLAVICSKCLEKRPEKRYRTAQELLEDLQNFQQNRPIKARPISLTRRFLKWSRRYPVTTALLVLISLTTAATFIAVTWHFAQVSHYAGELQQANAKLEDALREKDEQRQRAEGKELLALQHDYVSTIGRANELLKQNQTGFICDVLNHFRPVPGDRDLRGFEWHYLWYEGCRLRNLQGHRDDVYLTSPVNCNNIFASASYDRTIRFWDLNTNQLLHTWNWSDGSIKSFAWSADGKKLALGRDREEGFSIEIKEFPSDELTFRAPLNDFEPQTICFAGNGQYVLVNSHYDNQSRLEMWSVATGDRIWHNQIDHGLYALPSFCDNGTQVESYSIIFQPGHCIIKQLQLDARNGRQLQEKTFPCPLSLNSDFTKIAINDANTLIAVPLMTGGAAVQSLDGENSKDVIVNRSHQVRNLCFCSSDKLLAMSCFHGTHKPGDIFSANVQVLDLKTRKILDNTLAINARSVLSLPNTNELLLAGVDGIIRIWGDFDQGLRSDDQELFGHSKETWTLAFSPDGTTLASGSDDHLVKIWDVSTKKLLQTLQQHDSLVTSVAFSPSGDLLATAGYDRKVILWDTHTYQPLHIMKGHKGSIRGIAFSPDGRWLASTGRDGIVNIWNCATGELKKGFHGHGDVVHCIKFSPDGRQLACGDNDQQAILWDLEQENKKTVFPVQAHVHSLQFSPDGKHLALGMRNSVIAIFDLNTHKEIGRLMGHEGVIRTLDYSHDGRTLASGSSDGTIKLWQVATYAELLSLPSQKTQVNCVTFAPNGKLLASATHDGGIQLWQGR